MWNIPKKVTTQEIGKFLKLEMRTILLLQFEIVINLGNYLMDKHSFCENKIFVKTIIAKVK
jgi:hypothetical protein